MMLPPSLCHSCEHKHFTLGGDLNERPTCDAYPRGIPRDYWGLGAAHIDPDGSDNGIVFSSIGGEAGARGIEVFVTFWDEPADRVGTTERRDERRELDALAAELYPEGLEPDDAA